MLEEQHIMLQSKEIQEQMRNKIVDMCQSGNSKKKKSHYPQMEKTWNSGEPSQEWPAYQNYSKSATTTYPGGHKRTQNNI